MIGHAGGSAYSGAKKAATLLLSLGIEHSSQVLRCLGEEEMEQVMLALSQAGPVDNDSRRDVLQEAYHSSMTNAGTLVGGIEYTRQLVARTLGPHRGTKILERISAQQQLSSFDMLHNADPAQVAGMLIEEHPQTIALVLSYLDAKLAANTLTNLPRELQVDVTLRLAQMDRVSPQVIQTVERSLKHKLSGVISDADFRTTGGVTFLVRMLNQVDRGVQKTIFETLEGSHPQLVDEIRANMFTFDDLIRLDDRSIQRVLSEVNKQDLALSLKGATDKIQELIYRNLSERARETLKEEVELLGPQLARNVYAAQRKIVDIVRTLEESEEIIIGGNGGDSEVIV